MLYFIRVKLKQMMQQQKSSNRTDSITKSSNISSKFVRVLSNPPLFWAPGSRGEAGRYKSHLELKYISRFQNIYINIYIEGEAGVLSSNYSMPNEPPDTKPVVFRQILDYAIY